MQWRRRTVNQTLVGKLMKLVNGRVEEWDDHLDLALYAYRISPRGNGRPAPFELLYGRKPRMIHERTDDRPILIEEDNDLIFERIKASLDYLHQEEREIRDREIANLKHGSVTEDLKVNDVVLRKKLKEELESKLDSKWKGPYLVVENVGKGGYIIKDFFNNEFTVNRKDLSPVTETEEWVTTSKQGRMLDDSDLWRIRLPKV
jgi:hypothetical protein